MSDIYQILDSWEFAENYRKKGDYINAARNYRLCELYFLNGELEYYMPTLSEKSNDAREKYRIILSKLPQDTANKIRCERKKYYDTIGTAFLGSWREFASAQNELIEKEAKEFQENGNLEINQEIEKALSEYETKSTKKR